MHLSVPCRVVANPLAKPSVPEAVVRTPDQHASSSTFRPVGVSQTFTQQQVEQTGWGHYAGPVMGLPGAFAARPSVPVHHDSSPAGPAASGSEKDAALEELVQSSLNRNAEVWRAGGRPRTVSTTVPDDLLTNTEQFKPHDIAMLVGQLAKAGAFQQSLKLIEDISISNRFDVLPL